MDVIDGKWIEARLSGAHGSRKALADAIGITPDKITKIIKGERQVRANEIPLILRYFENRNTQQPGLSEPSAHFASGPIAVLTNIADTLVDIARLAAPHTKSPTTFTMQRSAFAAGLLMGDLLIVELGNSAAMGDLVLVTLNDTMLDIQTTVLRRFLHPQLVALDFDDQPVVLSSSPTLEAAILATIKAVVRLPKTAQT